MLPERRCELVGGAYGHHAQLDLPADAVAGGASATNLIGHGDLAQLGVVAEAELVGGAAPPPRLARAAVEAELRVNGRAALAALLDQLQVLVLRAQAGDDVDVQDEDGRAGAQAVEEAAIGLRVAHVDGPEPALSFGVANAQEQQGNGEQEMDGDGAYARPRLPHGTTVPRPVMSNGMPERDDDQQPGNEGQNRAGLEASVEGRGLGNGNGLPGIGLRLEGLPVSRNVHEEVLSRRQP